MLTKIHEAICDCTHLLVLISPASLKSHWVSYETGFAAARGKFVLPFLVSPGTDIPGFIRHLHYKSTTDELTDYFDRELAHGLHTKERLEQLLMARRYVLLFNPLGGRKNIGFGSSGNISVGRNRNEDSWTVVDGKLEIRQEDGELHSRFRYDEAQDKFIHTDDPDTSSIKEQVIEPLK